MKRVAELAFVILFSWLTLLAFLARMAIACTLNGWELAGEFLDG